MDPNGLRRLVVTSLVMCQTGWSVIEPLYWAAMRYISQGNCSQICWQVTEHPDSDLSASSSMTAIIDFTAIQNLKPTSCCFLKKLHALPIITSYMHILWAPSMAEPEAMRTMRRVKVGTRMAAREMIFVSSAHTHANAVSQSFSDIVSIINICRSFDCLPVHKQSNR